ncbi:hypothetical protein SAMN04488523_108110 [Sulfitobacter brevis]|uniref:Uncharacterized protein n=1 Tax=Sulfitobacter brevis TaxID=74348 RepID=A0A1I2BHT1_9RHOB|nr:hypothetical protein [Sulfitobacter brevis]SFE55734.1 hypothetical protein SAMN04488523_108110 [Sulfitobacter brevis]
MARSRLGWLRFTGSLTLAFYAVFLLGEFLVVGAFGPGMDAAGTLLIYVACLVPALGLAVLARYVTHPVSALSSVFLIITSLGGATLVFLALHVAPPDALNAVVIGMISLFQLAALAVLAISAAAVSWRRSRAVPSPP